MSLSMLGRKVGMTQIFTEDGTMYPATVLEVGPNYVLQVKSSEKEGYDALQVGFLQKKWQRVNRPLQGHFEKANRGAFYAIGEIRASKEELLSLVKVNSKEDDGEKSEGDGESKERDKEQQAHKSGKLKGDSGAGLVGGEIRVESVFQEGGLVNVQGTSKGRGFAGVVRRFNAAGQPATRGTHEYRRNIGSVGCRKFPGRIWKNQKMPGHMGNEKVTVRNLKVLAVDPENNLLFVKGGVPGAKGSVVRVTKAGK